MEHWKLKKEKRLVMQDYLCTQISTCQFCS